MAHLSGYAFTGTDIYTRIKPVLLNNDWVHTYHKDRKVLASKMLSNCLYEILLDIIENNVTFVVPLRFGNYAEIYAERLEGEAFKEAYRRGKFNKLDYIKTNFGGTRIVFAFKTRKGVKKKEIYLTGYLKKLFDQRCEEGKMYY